jgi:hypothetical protein
LGKARLVDVAPVLVSHDVRRTTECNCDTVGFDVVEHYESPEPF